ncbi:basic salivary proline-rich protein 1-like [Ovis aries]|uniref:basic salivary proline-rich protein 1-like n=1 Tax=Ovis aries TaxID=9940 RepID=UPI00295264B9|nr:basic salivary proline-rich protein 1-like [Ovis aries]
MSHVSGRPSLAPGGLQSYEMEQIRGTGSDGSAHAGWGSAAGQSRAWAHEPRRDRDLWEPRWGPRSPRGQARAGARVADGGAAGPVERRSQNPTEGDRAQACGVGTRRLGGAPHSLGSQNLGVFWALPFPRVSSRPPRPQKPSVQRPTAWAAVLPSPPPPPPGGPLRPPPPPPGSSLTTPGHLSQVASLTPAGSGPPRPPKVGARPAVSLPPPGAAPRAQQGLRGGRVVKLQFISVETEAQETGEPPRWPPKGMLTTRVSFPRPLTPHSHPRLSPAAAFRGPSPSTPRAHTLLPQGLCTCSPHRKLAHHHSRPSKTAEAIPTAMPRAACSSPA